LTICRSALEPLQRAPRLFKVYPVLSAADPELVVGDAFVVSVILVVVYPRYEFELVLQVLVILLDGSLADAGPVPLPVVPPLELVVGAEEERRGRVSTERAAPSPEAFSASAKVLVLAGSISNLRLRHALLSDLLHVLAYISLDLVQYRVPRLDHCLFAQ